MITTETQDTTFIDAFNKMAHRIYLNNVDKGWWEEVRNDGELIALMHSELSEALEGYRHGDPPDDKIPAYSSIEAELADTVIRIMDYAASRQLRVGAAICAKVQYNTTRPYRHGGKKA